MSHGKSSKKKVIIISVVIFIVAALIMGICFFVQYQNDKKTVEVQPVSYLYMNYWGDQTYSSGTIVSDYVQEIYPDSGKTITDLFVTQGQTVKIGDPLLQYDKTLLELDVEAADISVKEAALKVDTAQKQLKKLQNTTPVATAGPTSQPVVTPDPGTDTPTPSPSATPVPPADVTLYSRLDIDSIPYTGSGTTDDPYRFLCTSDCIMTGDFLRWLMGMSVEATPTPSPTTPPEDGDNLPGDNTDTESTPEDGTEATPTPDSDTSHPDTDVWTQMATPFAAVFEVREEDSNYGEIIAAFKLDGTALSGSFQIQSFIAGSNTLETVAETLGASSTSNYDDMGYTSSQLSELIKEKRQEIKDLQLEAKQADLDLEKAKLLLKNSTVLSDVDGVVRTLKDLETAAADGTPFMVVSGQEQYYVSGTLSENLLGRISVGDSVSLMSYDNGQSYTAQIVNISDYPQESGGYYSGGNPNSSNYEFTAVVEGAEGLNTGSYVEITMDVKSAEGEDSFYLDKAYVRDDDSGSYVMKVGIDNRLVKQYIKTGISIYSGMYIEVTAGLTLDDYLAFPYGADVKEGTRAVLQETGEPPFGENSAAGDTPANDTADGLPEGVPFETENGGGVILT